MSDLITEIDDALRRERMEKLWQAHGQKFIAALIALVILTAAWSFTQSWRHAAQEKQAAQLVSFLESADFPTKAMEASADFPAAPRAMARLQAAAQLLQRGENDQALNPYLAVSEDKTAPKILRQLADFMQVNLGVAKDPEQILKPIAQDRTSPWQAQALLALAAERARAGNYDQALDDLQTLQDMADIPPSLRGRAESLAQLYKLEKEKAGAHAPS